MAFAQAQNTTIIGSTFTDIQGGVNYYNSQKPETGIHGLHKAISRSAAYDAVERHPPPRCHPGTRVDLLKDIRSWIDDTAGKNILWVHGPAGAGKSAIAQTVCESCAERGELLASFFFFRGSPDRNTINKLIPTLAFHIALSRPDKRQAVDRIVEDDPLIMNRTIGTQLKKLIVEPLQHDSEPSQSRSSPFLILIDGLDECEGTSNQTSIISLVRDLVETYHLPLRFLILSRPEPHIEHAFKQLEGITLQISLLGDRQARDDIRIFLQSEFERIHDSETHSDIMKHVPKPWPSEKDLQLLVKRSDGYFIYASTLAKYVAEEGFSCIRRLHDVLNLSHPGTAAFAELDKLYTQILSTYSNADLIKMILGVFFTLDEDMTVYLFTDLFDLQPGEVMLALRGMHSILDFGQAWQDGDGDLTMCELHASLPEYLFDSSRSGIYFIDRETCREEVFKRTSAIIKNWEHRKNTVCRAWWMRYRFILFNPLNLNVSERPGLLDFIRTTMLASDWERYILDSESWSSDKRICLIQFFSIAVRKFQRSKPPQQDLVQQFTKFRSLAFQVFVHQASETEARAMQEIDYFYSFTWGYNDFCRYGFLHSYIADRGYLGSCDEMFDVMDKIIFCAHREEQWDVDLLVFMQDAFRNSTLYCSNEVCHSNIVSYCLEVLADNSRRDKDVVEYSKKYWASHLVHSGPDDENLLGYLRTIRPGSFSLSDISQIWGWLKKIRDPPTELLLRWDPLSLRQLGLDADTDQESQTSSEGDIRVDRGDQSFSPPRQAVERPKHSWVSNPILPEPGDEDFMRNLQILPPNSVHMSDIFRIWDWLKKMHDPPADLLLRWNPFALRLLGHYADVGEDS